MTTRSSVGGYRIADLDPFPGFGEVGATEELALDLEPTVVPEEAHRDRGVGVAGIDDDDGVGVVAELEVGLWPRDRRLEELRVSADVDAVRGVLDVLVTTPEHRVVERGGELADPTAHAVGKLPALDHGGGNEAQLRGPLANGFVEREGLTGLDDHAIDDVGKAVDVLHPVLAAAVVGREFRDEPQAASSLRPLRW